MKRFLFIVSLVLIVFIASACNKQIVDLTYSFDTAIISLPNGEVIEGSVDTWKDYEGDQIQVTIEGTTYLVHSSDAVLIRTAK